MTSDPAPDSADGSSGDDFFAAVGLRFRRDGDAVAAYLPRSAATVGPGGSVHGGLVATLVDVTCTGAIAAAANQLVTTVDVSASFMRAAQPPLEAVASVQFVGKTLGFATAIVREVDTASVVAHGSVTCRIHRATPLSDARDSVGEHIDS